jgi:hypothetical protein
MLIHQLPLDAAFGSVRSTPAGLSQVEAAGRRLEFGPNRIQGLARTPFAFRFLRQFTHFFAALLWAAAVLALIADWWMPGQGMATLAAAIVAVIVINGAFSFWQEYRAEETMAALQRLLPHQVRALGTWERSPALRPENTSAMRRAMSYSWPLTTGSMRMTTWRFYSTVGTPYIPASRRLLSSRGFLVLRQRVLQFSRALAQNQRSRRGTRLPVNSS